MAAIDGLVQRRKAENDAKRKKHKLAKTAAWGVPLAIVLFAIFLSFTHNVEEMDTNLRLPSGWMKDVAMTMRKGDTYYDSEQFDTAILYYKKAMKAVQIHDKERTTTQEESKLMRSYLFNSLGLSYVQLGNQTQAMTWYEKGLAVNGDHLELLYNYANVCAETKRWLQAEKHYRRAIELKPDFDLAMLSLAYVLQQHEAWDEARSLLFTAWEISKDKDIAAQLGVQYMIEHNADRALEWLTIAADLGHERAKHQRDELLQIWQKTRESLNKATEQGDTIELAEP
ncbi:hypothetical protein THRCLA_01412 [Thraustotheca clavata]|uniref:Tetratricopeptide repeat protein n=1 Tax=Thraustotheca clavata TaxID=74557 RepID=A0A1W0A963_9STRA|nr:hypothetical protein THRCLA_01412 [Thraustotheca clavata]